jgi:hypothetical protein
MKKHEIEYMVIQKNQTTYTATKEQEALNHTLAAWEVQQSIKNELDPDGRKGTNVIVNLNGKDDN